jgi:VWFA-related protein
MRSSPRVHPAVLAIACITAIPALAGSQDGEPPHVDPVHLDIVVTDPAGRPITGLQPAEVEVWDAGVIQSVEALTFVSRPADADGPERTGRLFGLLLDEFHVDPASTARVQDAFRRFITQEMRSDDRVVLVKPLDSLTGLQPSHDWAALEAAVGSFEGRRGEYEPRTPFETATMSRAPSAAAPERARVVLSALAALTHRLGTLGEGRKTLVFVSEGFGELPQRSRLRGSSVQTIVEAADRADVAIYTIDPRMPAAVPADDPALAMLRTLAEQTGGTSVSADRIDQGLAAAAGDLDGYYRVSYRPTHALDGRHELDVRVKRPNAEVRARAAHWAIPAPAPRPSEDAAATGSARLPRRAQQVSPLIDTWFGVARGSGGQTRVTFTWEPAARVQTPPAWLTLTAVGEDGQVLFDGRVDPIRAIGVGGLPTLSAVFEAPPGLLQIDMTIRGADGATVGTDSRDVRLPDLRATVFSTPAIIRTHNALQFRTLSADLLAPPAVSRRFSRTERLLVRVHAYAAEGPAAQRPEVTARLVGRRQETVLELSALPETFADTLVQFDVPLSMLSSGEYGIEIRAGDRRELILFDVTN